MFKFKLYNNVTGAISCYIESKYYSVDKTHPGYNRLLQCFKDNDSIGFVNAEDITQYIKVDSKGNLTGLEVTDSGITWNGNPIDSRLKDYIMAMRDDGFSIDYLIKFVENLMKNPSGNSVKQLWDFLSHKNMPINDEGAFVAYKAVDVYRGRPFVDPMGREVKYGDYISRYNGPKYRNNVGDIISCERNQVDDNPNNKCSYGFHVGALDYSGPNGFYKGDETVIVKVMPEDAVSVPRDHSSQKIRVCKYEVIGVFENPLNNSVYGEVKPCEEEYNDEIYGYCDDDECCGCGED